MYHELILILITRFRDLMVLLRVLNPNYTLDLRKISNDKASDEIQL